MKDGDSSDSLTRSTLMAVVPLLVLLFAPVAAWGEVTLFLEDFDDPELAHWSDQGGSRTGPVSMDYASCSVHDGYGFLNLSGTDPAEIDGTGGEFKIYSTEYYLYAGLEMRMRLSSDNKLESDVGGGIRRWGFRSGATQWALTFTSQEEGILPAKDQWWGTEHPGREYLGFGLGSRINDEFSFHQNIEGVDLTEWHTYTILWEPEAATYLIDDVVVAITKEVPQVPMRIYMRAAAGVNLTLPSPTVGQEETWTDECMQIDYVRVFASDERFREMDTEISGLLAQAQSLMDALDQENQNTTHLMMEYREAEADWEKGHYVYVEAKPRLEAIIDSIGHWDEATAIFAQASECIETFKKKGDSRNENMCRAFYSNALGTWEDCDHERTMEILGNIIVKCPETMLLYILGLNLILLPALLRREYRSSSPDHGGTQGALWRAGSHSYEPTGWISRGMHFCILRCLYKEVPPTQPGVSGGFRHI